MSKTVWITGASSGIGKTAKRYPKYGVQKGWERVTSPETGAENFSEITDAEAKQMGFPF